MKQKDDPNQVTATVIAGGFAGGVGIGAVGAGDVFMQVS